MDKVLALGGHANGKWMPDYGPYLKVPIPSSPVLVVESSSPELETPTYGRMRIDSYTKIKLGDPKTRKIAYVYALDGTPENELMDLLTQYLLGRFINGQGIYDNS